MGQIRQRRRAVVKGLTQVHSESNREKGIVRVSSHVLMRATSVLRGVHGPKGLQMFYEPMVLDPPFSLASLGFGDSDYF
jgi:hypothetical protein